MEMPPPGTGIVSLNVVDAGTISTGPFDTMNGIF